MVRTKGLSRALGRIIERVLGREDNHDSDEAGEGLKHPHVGSRKLSLLLRMLLTWMTQLKRSSNSLKKQVLMPRIF